MRLRIARIGARDDRDLCPPQRGERFALAPRGKEIPIRKWLRRVEGHDVQVAREREVLKPVVENECVNVESRLGRLTPA